jgi:hypothetical protein
MTYTVSREGCALDDALRFAAHAVARCDPECQEATAMVVSELVENMIKYSDGKGPSAGTLSIDLEGGLVRIEAVNSVAQSDDAHRVESSIASIAGSRDVAHLYHARIGTLYSDPSLPRTELGLLRAAFEGGVRLSCSFEPPLLHIVAERPCSGA